MTKSVKTKDQSEAESIAAIHQQTAESAHDFAQNKATNYKISAEESESKLGETRDAIASYEEKEKLRDVELKTQHNLMEALQVQLVTLADQVTATRVAGNQRPAAAGAAYNTLPPASIIVW